MVGERRAVCMPAMSCASRRKTLRMMGFAQDVRFVRYLGGFGKPLLAVCTKFVPIGCGFVKAWTQDFVEQDRMTGQVVEETAKLSCQ